MASNPTEQLPATSSATLSLRVEQQSPLSDLTEPTIAARQAFRRDLPRLLQTNPGEWVAYAGDRCLGFHASQRQLYQECYRKGFQRGHFLICCVEPEGPDEVEDPIEV